MFINKNVKYRKNPNPGFTELPCDRGDNDEGKVDGSIKDVGFDNVNAGDGENRVDLGDVYEGAGDSNDDVGVGNVGEVNTNGGDDTDFSDGDSKFDCGDDSGSGDSDNKDYGGVDDDGDADSNIRNATNCSDGRNKVDCSKEIVVENGNSKSDDGDANDDCKGGDGSDGESNECADGHKTDGDYEDDKCLISVKSYFKKKQIF